jgi:hypothetical protein
MNENPTNVAGWLEAYQQAVVAVRQAVSRLKQLGPPPPPDDPAAWDALLNLYRSLSLPAGGSSEEATQRAVAQLSAGLAAALSDGETFCLTVVRAVIRMVTDPRNDLVVWPLHHFAQGSVGYVRDPDLDWITLAPFDAMVNDCALGAYMKRADCLPRGGKMVVNLGPAIYQPSAFSTFDHLPVDWLFCSDVVEMTRRLKELDQKREAEAWRKTHGPALAEDERLRRLRESDPRYTQARVTELEKQVAKLTNEKET